jgi:hypothetical protein
MSLPVRWSHQAALTSETYRRGDARRHSNTCLVRSEFEWIIEGCCEQHLPRVLAIFNMLTK